ERDGNSRDVAQFDEFIAGVISGIEVGRVIHDFADDDGANARVGVGGAGALAELLDAARIVHAESAGAHGHEFRASVAGDITAKGDAVVSRVELDEGAIAGEGIVGGGAEGDLVAMRTESKWNGRFEAIGEVDFVDDSVAVRGKDGVGRDL